MSRTKNILFGGLACWLALSGSAGARSADDRELGRAAARKLAAQMEGHGRAMLLRRQIQVTVAEQREEGFLEIMAREFPAITLVATDYHAGPTPESARRVMTILLARYGREVDGIFISTEASAVGALTALQAAGLTTGKIKVVAISEGGGLLQSSLEKGGLQELLEGNPAGSPREAMSAASLRLPASACSGTPPLVAGERVVPDLGLVMVAIPPGELVCRRTGEQGDEGEFHIRISRAYWLGKYEVTQHEWGVLMDDNPSDFEAPCLPVDGVSWREAADFCARLTERERRAGRLPAGYVYALPSAGQWEYACRAGTDSVAISPANGWSRANSGAVYPDPDGWRMSTHPVGTLRSNAWGLHDMLGNVAEWCADWSGDYPREAAVDYVGPVAGTHRVLRGGSWWSDPQNCRSDHRHRAPPDRKHSALGFRLALVPITPLHS